MCYGGGEGFPMITLIPHKLHRVYKLFMSLKKSEKKERASIIVSSV